MLARGRDFVVARGRTYLEIESTVTFVCSTVTGGRTELDGEEASDVVVPVLAGFKNYVATLRDICPGGFEGCIAGLQVQRVPGLETVTSFTVGDGTEAVAVGAEGALAWVACPYAEEFDPTCEGPYTVLRLDARGRRVVGRGRRIAPRSLRAAPDGRSFTWKDAGRERRATWTGSPPAMLPDPPDLPAG